MSRRGVEMSMNLIVLIVIVLIVAAIVIYLVVKNSSNANNDLSNCVAKGGRCASPGTCTQDESASNFFTGGCQQGQICCVKLLGDQQQ